MKKISQMKNPRGVNLCEISVSTDNSYWTKGWPQVTVLMMFVQIKSGKHWMLKSNVQNDVNVIMSAKKKLGELTHREYSEWYTITNQDVL